MTASPSEPLPTDAPAVPLLDVGRGNQPLRQQILAAITRVCDSGRFLFGPDCQRLEEGIARVCQVEHAIGCASGSDALLLALMAVDIGPGDEVIVPSFTFFATASAVWRLGAKVVFADVDPHTFNLDPQQVERVLTPATKAIVPVHLFGQCAAMEPLCELARQQRLWLIEDAAQSLGARYADRPAGGWGDIGCFSFYPTKNLGGFGDGGMLTTSNEALADKLRLLASHGMKPRYYHSQVGINSRLDSIQAAVLNVKLSHLEAWNAQRQANAARYRQLLHQAGLAPPLVLPQALPAQHHVWNQYTLRVPDGQREPLRDYLAQYHIGTEIYYPVPLHLQQCFRSLGYGPGSLPVTEQAAQQVLSLPIFPELAERELQAVVARIAEFYASAP